MNDNGIKSLFEIFNLDLNSDVEIDQQLITNLKYNNLFLSCLPLSDYEIYNNFGFLNKVVDDYQKCQNESKDFCPNFGYHLDLKRDKKTQSIIFYYSPCKKTKKKIQFFEKQKVFLYNSYADNDFFQVLSSEKLTSVVKQKVLKRFEYDWKNKTKKGIYIYGKSGVGKTFLFRFITATIAQINSDPTLKIALIFMPELVESIKKSFGNKQNEKLLIYEAALNADYLFLDDIGAEYATDWFYSNYFLLILNSRISQNKPTFFNSNFSLFEYEKKLINLLKSSNSKIEANRIIQRIKRIIGDNIYEIKDERYCNQNQ
ncbi:MAG: ATP-binding protein [Malacoplasma sp.]|nr:ATP-binding protein [Malacoplasma sp.]